MSKSASKLQEKVMAIKFRGKEIFKPHDPTAPYDAYDESDDTKEQAKSVRLKKALPVSL